MKLFDPARPLSPHGQPMLASGGLVPIWYLRPGATEGKVKILVFLLTSGLSSYRDFTLEAEEWELQTLWRHWLDDPEDFVARKFGYRGPVQATSPSAHPLLASAKIDTGETLEDLGL